METNPSVELGGGEKAFPLLLTHSKIVKSHAITGFMTEWQSNFSLDLLSMLKRSFSFFFLLIFLANSVGFSLITLLQIRIHHESTRLDRHKEKIVDLRISIKEMNSPASTFRWLEKNEFAFHGHRYDVISFHTEKDILVFKCFDDTKEESLYKKLEAHNSTNENNLPAKNKNTTLKKGIDYDNSYYSFSCLSFASSKKTRSVVEIFSPTTFISVTSPPPRLV